MTGPDKPLLMLVEDERDTRTMLAMGLELQGYRVSQAPDGQAALDLLEAGPLPALVLLDRMMPRMDGLQLLEHMAAEPRLASVPAVLLSGDEELADSPRAQHARRVLSKPVGMPRLVQVVQEILGEV